MKVFALFSILAKLSVIPLARGEEGDILSDVQFLALNEDDIVRTFNMESMSRKRYKKHQKNRAKEEIVKANVNACEPDYLLWPDSPEAWYACPWTCSGCDYPHTEARRNFVGFRSCYIPDIPPCPGPDRYFYKPPTSFLSIIPLQPLLRVGIGWFLGKNANPACRTQCSGYHTHWCAGFGGMPYCTIDASDCLNLNWEQYGAVGSFLANFLPIKGVKAIVIGAKAIQKHKKAAYISRALRGLAKKQLKKMKKKAINKIKDEIKGLAEDLKDELLEVALEEMLLEQAKREDPDFGWDEVGDFMRAVDVVGIFDLTDAFWKQECSVFEPEEITEDEPERCASIAEAKRSSMGVEGYWNDHSWDELCAAPKTHWRRIGYSKRKWDGPVSGYPRAVHHNWKKLQQIHKNAAVKLGYTQRTWNDADVLFATEL